jgi:cystathionine gamma-synthase
LTTEDPDLRGAAFETRAIHAGQAIDPHTGSVVTPIFQTSIYASEDVDTDRGFTYGRTGNPTRLALETCLASLEGAVAGFCFGSGVAAEDAALRLLRPGDHLVVPDDFYGGTYRLLTGLWEPLGVTFSPAPLTGPAWAEALEAAWRPSTRMVWIESPTNPRLGIVDIAAVAGFARQRGALCVVDNTLASPWLQQPLALGADLVVHSTTKYIGGHSDVIGGFVGVGGTGPADLAAQIALTQRGAGSVPGPFDCFLTLRGVKTLALRMERHCANAAAVAAMLDAHPAVSRVYYPGLASHPGHDLAARQMRGFGGMVSLVLANGEHAAKRFCAGLRLFALAGSLGGVESIVSHPASMSHSSMRGTELAMDPAVVRLSVGLEGVDDLVADLRGALDPLG